MTATRTLLASITLLSCLQAAWAADLNVTVSGVRSAQGSVRIAVYDREEGFRKEAQARLRQGVPAAPGQVEARFSGLPAGRYAVIAYHDEDGNGRLDLRFGMIPIEGYGLSNVAEVSGPPRFQDAAFDLREPAGAIEMRLNY